MTFWRDKTLEEFSAQEWESLCDHCGLCCLVRLQDEDSGEVFDTNIICRHYDCESNRCKSYGKRTRFDDGCVELTPSLVREFSWLPDSCAYRIVDRGGELPAGHPLVCGEQGRMPTVTQQFAGIGLVENGPGIDPEQYLIAGDC